MGRVNQELLDIRNVLSKRGINGFFYDLDMAIAFSPKQMDNWIRHEGFSEEKSDFWRRSKKVGNLQFLNENPERVIEELIEIYQSRGFTLKSRDKKLGKILFEGEEGRRKIYYSFPMRESDSVLTSFYQDY